MRAYLTFSSLLVLALGLAPRLAHAQSTCAADSDCVKGWTCQVVGGSACASTACAPGEKCESRPIDCMNVDIKSCRPGPCVADSDCADGMVCYSRTETNCAPSACAAGQACPAPACETKTESGCVPRYVLPCSNASDCGPGFQCESSGEQCSCSGSAGVDGASGGGASGGGTSLPSPQESCTCEPSKELRCRAAAVNCNADSDCLAGWSCAVVSSTSDCATAPASNPTPGAGAQGGATPAPDCSPSLDVKQCTPPYYALVKGSQDGARDSAGTPATDETTSNGVPAAPSAESGTDGATSSAGCSVGHSSRSGSALALLGLLGVFGALRRRRA